MARACIYTRYSSANQRDASIADQERNCRRRAESLGADVVQVFADRAISGARNDRPQYLAMLEAAKAGDFGILLVDDLSRLSRDAVESERSIRLLEFDGVRVVGVCDGYDSEQSGHKLIRGMRGIVNELYLDDLREKVHRGQTGLALEGFSAGGRPYGYRSVQTGDGVRWEIDPEQAAVVIEIFETYTKGHSPRTIVADLNRRGIPSIRGGSWAFSALYGHPQKGTGLLRNRTYIGELIWNRSQWLKNPATGKRVRRERSREEWITRQEESLRIIEQDLWDAVEARLSAQGHSNGAKRDHTRAKYLLSGLLRCGSCGAPLSMANGRNYQCSHHHYRGSAVCPEKGLVHRLEAEHQVLAGVKTQLLQPRYQAIFAEEVKRLLAANSSRAPALRAELRRVEDRLGKLIESIALVGASGTIAAAIREAEAQKSQLETESRSVEREKVTPIWLGDIPGTFRSLVESLEEVVTEDVLEAREALKGIVGEQIPVYWVDGLPYGEMMTTVPALTGTVALDGSGGRI